MKNRGKVKSLNAIFIKDEITLKSGIRDGWISIFKQGRQPDGSPRNPKYMMNLDKIPNEICTVLK